MRDVNHGIEMKIRSADVGVLRQDRLVRNCEIARAGYIFRVFRRCVFWVMQACRASATHCVKRIEWIVYFSML